MLLMMLSKFLGVIKVLSNESKLCWFKIIFERYGVVRITGKWIDILSAVGSQGMPSTFRPNWRFYEGLFLQKIP